MVFVYAREDGVRVSQTIEAVSGSIIESSYRPLSWAVADALPEQNRIMTQRTVAGLVPAGGTGPTGREIVFERPVTEALRTLDVGQVVSVGMTETSRFGGKTMRLNLPVVIRYEACGVLRMGEVDEPVRVYRVSSAGRSRTREGIDAVRRSETAIYLSDRAGFPLAYQGQNVTVAESAQKPPG
ncbi:hypothetical protein [Brevundimonas sp. A19_0]|uniref:hypothetical protein n=1 Tax=Brevundimonas sp. A19_0 TaxID=2821087 RepID=UPI001ADAC05C|nr:hypothetical protein [Brevundimonas sp. A19_0]MBO9500565.1 hypothetical protein [Brevundimonas sp. A19_0]